MRTHPAFAIRQALGAHFPRAVAHMLDAEYATLTGPSWVDVHQDFADSMFAQGLPEWLADKGDCDDWAWLFRARVIERNWHQHASRVPVACFYIHYTTRQGEFHAANAVIIREGDQLRVHPLEPQPNGGLFVMTAEERSSCTLIIG
jgi:hypothetical protein